MSLIFVEGMHGTFETIRCKDLLALCWSKRLPTLYSFPYNFLLENYSSSTIPPQDPNFLVLLLYANAQKCVFFLLPDWHRRHYRRNREEHLTEIERIAEDTQEDVE